MIHSPKNLARLLFVAAQQSALHFLAFNPDQPRDDDGKWGDGGEDGVISGAKVKQAKEVLDKKLGKPGKRRKLNVDVLNKLSDADLVAIHEAYQDIGKHADQNLERMSAKATARAIELVMRDRSPQSLMRACETVRWAAFNPDQPRDKDGKFAPVDGGSTTPEQQFKSADDKFARLALREKDVRNTTLPRDSVYSGDSVDGLRVRTDIPNTDSISASFNDSEYEELPGLRSIPIEDLGVGDYSAVDDNDRVATLVEQIKESGEISPLIVVVDSKGPYVLEGNHRARAVKKMGKKNVPALVIIHYDKEEMRDNAAPTWKAIHKAADSLRPRAHAVAKKALNKARQSVRRGSLLNALANKNEKRVLSIMSDAITKFEKAFRQPFIEVLADVHGAAGAATAKELAKQLRTAAFNPDQPRDEDGKFAPVEGGDASSSQGSGSIDQVSDSEWQSFRSTDKPDDYYYHVTLEPTVKKIVGSQELKPGKSNMGRGSYESHSDGRVFLTDRDGVFYWAERAEAHAFDQYDDPPDVKVVRVKKSDVSVVIHDDKVGSKDARAKAYYTEEPIRLKKERQLGVAPSSATRDTQDLRDAAHLRVAAPKIKGFAFDRTNPRAKEWVEDHVGELIDGISKSTRESIRELVDQAFDGEFDTHDLADHITELIGDESRAETIARTETMAASNGGQREAWAQAVDEGLLNGDEEEEWIVTPDDKLCPVCQPMDGVRKPLNGKFKVDGDEIDGPPAHPRCRCTTGLALRN